MAVGEGSVNPPIISQSRHGHDRDHVIYVDFIDKILIFNGDQ